MSRSRGSALISRVLQRGSSACSCSYSHNVVESGSALYSASFSTATARSTTGIPAIVTQLRLEAVSQNTSNILRLPRARCEDHARVSLFSSWACRHVADILLPSGPCQVKQAVASLRQAAQGSSEELKELLSARRIPLMRSLTSTFHRDPWA